MTEKLHLEMLHHTGWYKDILAIIHKIRELDSVVSTATRICVGRIYFQIEICGWFWSPDFCTPDVRKKSRANPILCHV